MLATRAGAGHGPPMFDALGMSPMGALPFGMLFLLGAFLNFRRRRMGLNRSRRDMPRFANELGLQHRSTGSDLVGQVSGQLAGFDVFVDPDVGPRIKLLFRRPVGIELRTFSRTGRVPDGMTLAYFDKSLNRFFKDRHVSHALAADLDEVAGSAHWTHRLNEFREGHERRLQSFRIDTDGMEAVFDFGKPAYLPGTKMTEILKLWVKIAESLEAADFEDDLAD